MRIRTICLDLDDTLIPNSYRYNMPTWKCGLIITKALGVYSPYASELMKIQLEKDLAMVEEYGFDARRYPLSWVQTYEELCARNGLVPDPKVSKRLLSTAARFKFGPFRTFPGVISTLHDLVDDGRHLVLVTVGDEKLQQRKIDQAGVGPLFREVHITSREKGDVLASVAGDDPASAMMVGDSKRSDITPAIEIGMHAVWIPSNTWVYANAELDEGSYHVAQSVNDLPAVIAAIESGKRRRRRTGGG